MGANTDTQTLSHTRAHTRMYAHMRVHVFVQILMSGTVYLCFSVYINSIIDKYLDKHTHTHTHTHTLARACLSKYLWAVPLICVWEFVSVCMHFSVQAILASGAPANTHVSMYVLFSYISYLLK